jgi:SAM-dependent methyltransferase
MTGEQAGRSVIETAADLAAIAALLEMAQELGIVAHLESGAPFTLADLAATAGTPADRMAAYVTALAAAGIVVPADHSGAFTAAGDFAEMRSTAGYILWALKANRPFTENPLIFFKDHVQAERQHVRNPRDVAVTARWVGLSEFYPAELLAIVDAHPSHVADLGAGAAGLLIEVLRALPDATGVALDISAAACAVATEAAERAGVGPRLRVVERSIESLADDPSPLAGADVIHSGFAFHDLVAEKETFQSVLESCQESLRPGGFLAITDSVPYSPGERERKFSALFTYLHEGFMNVSLPTEEEWKDKFLEAGFTDVVCRQHLLPGARLFLVKA